MWNRRKTRATVESSFPVERDRQLSRVRATSEIYFFPPRCFDRRVFVLGTEERVFLLHVYVYTHTRTLRHARARARAHVKACIDSLSDMRPVRPRRIGLRGTCTDDRSALRHACRGDSRVRAYLVHSNFEKIVKLVTL